MIVDSFDEKINSCYVVQVLTFFYCISLYGYNIMPALPEKSQQDFG
jgi:hypothetical protein